VLLNSAMGFISKLEIIPQHLAGTAVMAILKRMNT
jgi:hypothetical protein